MLLSRGVGSAELSSNDDKQHDGEDDNSPEMRDWKKFRRRLRNASAFFVMAAPGWWPIVEHFLP